MFLDQKPSPPSCAGRHFWKLQSKVENHWFTPYHTSHPCTHFYPHNLWDKLGREIILSPKVTQWWGLHTRTPQPWVNILNRTCCLPYKPLLLLLFGKGEQLLVTFDKWTFHCHFHCLNVFRFNWKLNIHTSFYKNAWVDTFFCFITPENNRSWQWDIQAIHFALSLITILSWWLGRVKPPPTWLGRVKCPQNHIRL